MFYPFKEELQSAHIICNKNIFAILKLPFKHFAYFMYTAIRYLPNMLQKSPSTKFGCNHFNCGQLKLLPVHFLDLHRHTEANLPLCSSYWPSYYSSPLPSWQTLTRVRQRAVHDVISLGFLPDKKQEEGCIRYLLAEKKMFYYPKLKQQGQKI